VLGIIALSLGLYAQVDNEKELQKAIAELDKADPKWRLDDILAERRPIPDEQNSALLVLASAKLIPPDWPVKSAIGEDERTLREVLPVQLAALVPEYIAEIPQDPFDGKPLRMARLTDGMIIYSVGHDRADDGGNLIRNSGPKPGTDLGFRLYDPHCRRKLPLPPPEGLGADPLP
jgi:hypothetical protein